jgi:hypothetical protein
MLDLGHPGAAQAEPAPPKSFRERLGGIEPRPRWRMVTMETSTKAKARIAVRAFHHVGGILI